MNVPVAEEAILRRMVHRMPFLWKVGVGVGARARSKARSKARSRSKARIFLSPHPDYFLPEYIYEMTVHRVSQVKNMYQTLGHPILLLVDKAKAGDPPVQQEALRELATRYMRRDPTTLPLYITRRAYADLGLPSTSNDRLPFVTMYDSSKNPPVRPITTNMAHQRAINTPLPPPRTQTTISSNGYHRNEGNHLVDPVEPSNLRTVLLILFHRNGQQRSQTRKMIGLFFSGANPESKVSQEMKSYLFNTAMSNYRASGGKTLAIRDATNDTLTEVQKKALKPSFDLASGRPMLILMSLKKVKGRTNPTGDKIFRYFSAEALRTRKLDKRNSKFQHFT